MQEVEATIKRTGVLLKGANGKSDKTVTHKDFIQGLTSLFGEENVELESEGVSSRNPFLLPPNVYLFHSGKRHAEIGMFYRERTVPLVKFRAGGSDSDMVDYPDFRLPNIVISVRLKTTNDPRDKSIAYAFDKAMFFATDKGPLALPNTLLTAPDTRNHIWALPLPNMYAEGRMCYGENSILSTYTKDLRSLHLLYRMIHESPFNSDLSIPGITVSLDPHQWVQRIASEYSDNGSFPYHLLSHYNSEQHTQNQAEFQYAATNME